jgi:hypothetical protein
MVNLLISLSRVWYSLVGRRRQHVRVASVRVRFVPIRRAVDIVRSSLNRL